MTDAFEEVEEELRRDRYTDFFRKHAFLLIAAVVAILAGVGGMQAWRHWQVQQGQVWSERMAAAQDKLAAGDFAGAEAAYGDIAKKAPPGYKSAALLQQGGARLQQGDEKGALAAFSAAAKAAPSPIVRDLATLKAAYLAADTEDLAALDARLKPLVDASGAFAYQARELLGLQALAAGNKDRAREEFDYLSLALETPEGVRQRARTALQLIGPPPEGASPPADAPKQESGAKP